MKILVTRKLPSSIMKMLGEGYEVFMWDREDKPIPRDLLLQEVKEAAAILTNVSDEIDAELFANAPNLKVVSTMAVGYNNIDTAEAARRGIQVGHTPDVLTEAVADLTFSLLLAVARRVVEGMQYIKEGKWQGWGPFLLTGQRVFGATIGIIGMGRIGEGVARRAKGFGMRILYHNRSRKMETEAELAAEYVSLELLLQQSDYVVMLAPATPQTFKMIGAEQLKMMKSNAIIINTSRGENIDETALYDVLKTRKIRGAGLDVFEKEPIAPTHPLLQLDNVIALPHIGSSTEDTRMRMAEIAARNILAGLSGQRLLHAVELK